MVESSLLYSLFLKIQKHYQSSKIINWFYTVLKAVERNVKECAVVRFCKHHGNIEQYAASSVFYKIIKAVFCGILNLCRKIYEWLRNINSGSINQNIYNRFICSSFFCKTENILAIATFVIIIIPHSAWNNMYALGFALLFSVIYILAYSSGKQMGCDTNGIWLPLILFALSVILGIIISYDRGDSIRVGVFFVTSFILCLCVYGTLTDYKRINRFMQFLYYALILVSAVALYQRVTGVKADASLTDLTLNNNMPGRVFGTLGNPNNFAEFLIMFIPFGAAYALNIENKDRKTAAILGLILPVAALLNTYSRSSWIAFALSVIIFILLQNRKSIPLWIFAAVCLIPIIPQSITDRIMTIGNMKDSSSAYRVNIWKGTLDMMKHYKITGIGIGPGAFTSIFPPYALANTKVAPHSHMQFLEIWVEMGIVGLISFVWLTVSVIKRSFTKWLASKNMKIKNITAAACASAVGIMINGIFEYLWFYPRIMFLFFMSLGLIMATARISGFERKD